MQEKVIQQKLAYVLKGKCEVPCPLGRVDILTENSIIEVKHIRYAKHALGQINSYSIYFPSHKKKLYLFGYATQIRKWDIELACKKYDVEVIFEGSVILA